MPLGPTTGRTDALLLTLVLAVLGAGSGVLGVGCSQSFTPLEPEPEPIPVFASSPRELISEVIVDIPPDSVWTLEDGRNGACFCIPIKDTPINWINRTLDFVGSFAPEGQTELHVLDGPGGNVVLSWEFYNLSAIPEARGVYYPLPTSVTPVSLIVDNTVWVEIRLVRFQTLRLRIVEKAVPYDVIQLPSNTVGASLIHSSAGIGLLAVLHDGRLVELDANGTLIRTWNSSWPNPESESWLSATFADGHFLFLRRPFLFCIGPEDAVADTLGQLPGCVGIASASDRLYTIIKGGPDQNATLLSYDLAAVLAGSDLQTSRQDSVALSFNTYLNLFDTADGALLTFDNRQPPSLIYLFPSGLVVGEWVFPFYLTYTQSAYFDGTGLFLVPCALDNEVIFASWGGCFLPPVVFRFPVTIDP
jgi:hypothetical protein